MIKFEVKSRLTGNVQFVAEIECDESTSTGVKLRLAVEWACKSGAKLYGANLSGVNLCGADLSGANLSRADLSGARQSREGLARSGRVR